MAICAGWQQRYISRTHRGGQASVFWACTAWHHRDLNRSKRQQWQNGCNKMEQSIMYKCVRVLNKTCVADLGGTMEIFSAIRLFFLIYPQWYVYCQTLSLVNYFCYTKVWHKNKESWRRLVNWSFFLIFSLHWADNDFSVIRDFGLDTK